MLCAVTHCLLSWSFAVFVSFSGSTIQSSSDQNPTVINSLVVIFLPPLLRFNLFSVKHNPAKIDAGYCNLFWAMFFFLSLLSLVLSLSVWCMDVKQKQPLWKDISLWNHFEKAHTIMLSFALSCPLVNRTGSGLCRHTGELWWSRL